ncbi:MAG: integrase core domain-containing protein, partial [Patescibacteria group bacterium]|nr:integrase core domain-containing protein [Patescibacteria group bacterium]
MEFFNRIHCKYTGIKGFITVYNDAIKYRYMITEKALRKARILAFWEKYGLEATMEAFQVKRRALFNWKKRLREAGGKFEGLNDKLRAPRRRRKRLWPLEVIAEIKHLREKYPNLGKEKIYPVLKTFCETNRLFCPKPKTIGRLIKDLGGLRMFPQKISHFGKIKKANRQKILRKPKDFKALYVGHLVALDTVERFVNGCRRYVITFEDIYTRFSFAWATKSHASLAAKEFFGLCRRVFPYPFGFQYVLTDNGSEFKKHFDEELRRLHMSHYHTYPKTPKMNSHLERFNRTIQEEFIDYHAFLLLNPDEFNRSLIDWLIWYNTERVHYAFSNKLSPVQFMLSLSTLQVLNIPASSAGGPQECKIGWPYTP